MTVYEDHCVDCGLPCLGSRCKHKNVMVKYCDRCKSYNVVYEIEGEDLCESCATDVIKEIFEDMTLYEKAEACSVHLVDWR